MSESTTISLPTIRTIPCPYCSVVVPDATYCGACGAHFLRDGHQAAQRLHSYAAFPDEPVLRLSVVTAIFPHLSHRAKVPFRFALGLIVALLGVFAFEGATAPLIAVSALGIPLLFLLYVLEVDPYEGSFIPPTCLAIAFGAALGVGWSFLVRSWVDEALQPSLPDSATGTHAFVAGVAVPLLAVVLMCAPMAVVRLMQQGSVESLDGFVAGASSALGFTLAASIVLLSPWLTRGQLTHDTFVSDLSQGFIRGVTWPLISAMTTGLVGATLWVTTGGRATAARGRWMSSPVLALVVAAVIQIASAYVNLLRLPDSVLLVIQLGFAALLIVVTRVGLHQVLLHEALSVTIGPPRECPQCSHLVPAMAFCPQCGIADRAIARIGRRQSVISPASLGSEP